jgi:C4-dicarboxylate transporter DctQ subunit
MRLLDYLEEGVITFLMVAMTLVSFLQVIARYVFNYNFVWAMELTGVMFAWLIFIGMSYGVRVGAHIGVDALVKSLGPKTARIVGAVAAALCIVYALLVAFGGYQYVSKMFEVGILMQDLPVPSWVPRAILPIGFLLLAFRFSQVLYLLVTGQSVNLLLDEAEDALKMREDEPASEVRK